MVALHKILIDLISFHTCVINVSVPEVPKDVNYDTLADAVKLTWPQTSDPDIKNYTVSWYPSNDKNKKKSKPVSGGGAANEAFIKEGLEPDTYYTVELTANSDEGNGKPWIVENLVVGRPDRKYLVSAYPVHLKCSRFFCICFDPYVSK